MHRPIADILRARQLLMTPSPFIGCALMLALTGCTDGSDGLADLSCEADVEVPNAGGETVVRITEASAPCHLEFAETGAALRGAPDGDHPDPGTSIVRDRTGRFYTANAPGFPGKIAVWSPAGEYIESFGRIGQGPGEFTYGVTLFVDAENNLHVQDGGRWHLFTPDLEFVRTTVAPAKGGEPESTQLLDDGRVLTSQTVDPVDDFQLVDSMGTVLRTISSEVEAPGPWLVTSEGRASFWGGATTSAGYVLEEWDLNGNLLRTIHREGLWESSGNQQNAQIVAIHLDDRGFLLVVFSYPGKDWRPITAEEMSAVTSTEELMALSYRGLEAGIEVIESRSGALLASDRFPADAFPMGGAFSRTNLGFKLPSGPDLVPQLTIVEYNLMPK